MEIDFEQAIRTVPAEAMKMKRPHRVPLARLATVFFRELHGMTVNMCLRPLREVANKR
jgi:hypothetical protein